MKLSQKRAISYQIAKRNQIRAEKYLTENGMMDDFKKSGFVSITKYAQKRGAKI